MQGFFLRKVASVALLSAAWLAVSVESAYAGCGCPACAPVTCQYQTVEQTVYVPEMVPETRIVNVTHCVPEVHERTVTVNRCVPETKQVRQMVTVMVPQKKVRTQYYTVARPVWEQREQSCTVMVPYTEVREGVRTVCRPVAVQTTKTVCRDAGQWVCQACPCGDPCCQETCMVWCPNIIEEEVPCTVYRNEYHQERFKYNVTVCRPEVRKRMVKVCRYTYEKQQRQVAYTVCVPEQREVVRNVTTYRMVPEQVVQKYTVMVPQTVQKEVTVMVCRMVPKVVTCQVPVPCCN